MVLYENTLNLEHKRITKAGNLVKVQTYQLFTIGQKSFGSSISGDLNRILPLYFYIGFNQQWKKD